MFSELRHPTYLAAGDLDAYLEKGWFRMNQKIFITHFLHFDWHFYPAVWLRYDLRNGVAKHIEKRLRPTQRRFKIEVTRWLYTAEQEVLYALYRKHTGLDMAISLLELLKGQSDSNIFDTYQVSIHDGHQLIAVGFFDMGKTSAAGISCIYHPEYSRFSLGKALIYAKMDYCKGKGMEWFYPGYVVPGHKKFNYKLDLAPGHTAFFCPEKTTWLPLLPPASVPDFLSQMERKLMLFQELLLAKGVSTTLIHYKQFDATLMDMIFPDLLNYPVFLHYGYDAVKQQWSLIVYDFSLKKYRLLLCQTLASLGSYRTRDKIVCTDLLQVTTESAAGHGAEDLFPLLFVL